MSKQILRKGLLLVLLLLVSAPVLAQTTQPPAAPGPTLTSILARREIACGVNQDLYGFGFLDPNTGNLNGFDVDFCRAVAAAIFGDAAAVSLQIFSDEVEGKTALRDGKIDLLMRNAVITLTDDATGLEFAPVNFYSGQSIMVRTDNPAQQWSDLDGRTICVTAGSSAESNLPVYTRSLGITVALLTVPSAADGRDALLDGRCDAQSDDVVELSVLQRRAEDPTALRVWQGSNRFYTRDPYAPLIKAGDDQWINIVRWTMLGLIEAEQLGISSETLPTQVRQVQQAQGQTATQVEADADYTSRVGLEIARFLDPQLGIGYLIGLSPNFMLPVIREVGNYAEIYNRHLGPDGELPIDRGLNNLWSNAGLLYAPQWR